MENLRFRLLRPLEVWDRDGPVDLGGLGQQLLLAVLLLNANQVVTIQRLVDALWGLPIHWVIALAGAGGVLAALALARHLAR
ncbi:hypothetical protein [Micromonospora narathiwatensis]|uniref:Uncharacterized protein n=1 Tax=Micromonospora narathiwatensis TaxID=299146 RepID=A0A1A8ZJA2_9ACTN|nr:hypothetical protein [Micromonospora narathiwatensis]SBT43914.1 hypothetical protein GA0070621_1921 [Micromonospora narathiwatensis]